MLYMLEYLLVVFKSFIVFIYKSTVLALLVKDTAAATWINNNLFLL